MKTIKKSIHELEIQKSKFICYMDIVHSEEDVKEVINNIKIDYPGATHYCYAYIIDNTKRFQDDGEPGGTAGMPILHVLESQNLQHIIAVVVRYFGGIKLGAGGLVRAYTNSVSECIQNSNVLELEECNCVTIEFDYSNLKQIDYLLQNHSIIKKEFNEKIKYEIAVSHDYIDSLIKSVKGIIEEYIVDNNIIYKEKNQELS